MMGTSRDEYIKLIGKMELKRLKKPLYHQLLAYVSNLETKYLSTEKPKKDGNQKLLYQEIRKQLSRSTKVENTKDMGQRKEES